MPNREVLPLIAGRAKALKVGLNDATIDAVRAAEQALSLFEEASDDVHVRWLNLELNGYRDLATVRPLHELLGLPAGDRLAAHVGAYRLQQGIDESPGSKRQPFAHFFVESLPELIAARDRVRTAGSAAPVKLSFGPHERLPEYPVVGEFSRDVFERIVVGFIAALQLELGLANE